MSRQHVRKENENAKASIGKGVEDVKCCSVFGQYSEEEMIAQLRGLALDPCMPQYARDNIKPLWNQILGIRKLMVLEDSQAPWVWSLTFNSSINTFILLLYFVL